MTDTSRIYVASLSDYNSGRLIGRWIDCESGVDYINQEVAEMLKNDGEPGAEEWAIHDYEGFGGIKLGEWESFSKIADLGELIMKYGAPFLAWCTYSDEDQWTEEAFEEAYSGQWGSMKDFAMDYSQEVGDFSQLPDNLQSHIDWDSYAASFEDDFTEINGYIFRTS